MSEEYSLTVLNNSDLGETPTFAVFASLPKAPTKKGLELAWLTQPINTGNTYEFTWTMKWAFVFSAIGNKPGYKWTASNRIDADPRSKAGCSANFKYVNGDYQLALAEDGTPSDDGDELYIFDGNNVPSPTPKKASSVGVALNDSPCSMMEAGPNLDHTFTLHPTYYINAGEYVDGQMVDGATVADFQKLEFKDGNTALTAILNSDNTWSVKPTAEVDFARLLPALRRNQPVSL